MVSFRTTGYLEDGLWHQIDANSAFGAERAILIIAQSSPPFVFLGRPRPLQQLTFRTVIHCCQL